MTILRTVLIAALLLSPLVRAAPQNLPDLGDASSGLFPLEQERRLGQQFLRSLLSQVPTESDPLLKDYLEHLIFHLAEHSELKDRRLDLVVIKSSQLNAFAAPGGIVGVNTGIFRYAQSEHELAGILAHELAHVSQRHFARGAEQGRKTAIVSMAGLIASVVLMATAGADAGMAALMSSQGIAQQESLRYSRSREAEADRVGINTLVKADMNPRAIALMFERLAQLNRLAGSRVPDFLLTHPVTRSRISDAYNQTSSLPLKEWPLRLDYQLMRTRVQIGYEESPVRSETLMRERLKATNAVERTVATYGLVLALIPQRKYEEALRHARTLRREAPLKIAYAIAEASIHTAAEDYQRANEVLAGALAISPDNYPLVMQHAAVLLKMNEPEAAARLLVTQSLRRPSDVDIWYLLAETYGLMEDIPGVHQARAEYFVRTGNLDQAIRQLQFAVPLVRDDFQLNARITQRIREVHELREEARRM